MGSHADLPTERTPTYRNMAVTYQSWWGDGSKFKTKMHLRTKLSSSLLIKAYLKKNPSGFLCFQSHGFHSWFSSDGWRPWHRRWREQRSTGLSPASALSYSMLGSGLLQPRLGSFLQLPHHFLPLPTTQAKAWPSEEDGEDTPTRSIPNSLRGPLPAFLVCCWLCSLEEGLNHDSSLSRSHSILRSRVPNPWYPFLFPFLGPSQSFWAAPSHSSLASFCLFPGTWSISTPSFSLSRQNFIHIW